LDFIKYVVLPPEARMNAHFSGYVVEAITAVVMATFEQLLC